MSLSKAFQWYRKTSILTLRINAGALVIWEGRIEDLAVNKEGIQFVAFGFFRAYSDIVDTVFYGKSGFDQWKELDEPDNSPGIEFFPDRFEIKNDLGTLQISPKKGETFYDGIYGAIGYRIPEQSRLELTRVSFTYRVELPADWRASLKVLDGYDSGGGIVTPWNVLSTGATATGTVTNLTIGSIAGFRNAFYFEVHHDTVTPTPYAGETGESFLRITSFKITTIGDGTGVGFPQERVIADQIANLYAINPHQVHPSTALVVPTGFLAFEGVYPDTTPEDVIDSIAAKNGYDTLTGTYFPIEYGVTDDKRLYFRRLNSNTKGYYVEIEDIELERILETMFNGVYATYKDERFDRRTTTAYDNFSRDRYGISRITNIDTEDTGEDTAQDSRDFALSERRDAKPRASLDIVSVYNEFGARIPLWNLRYGDFIRVKNLTPITVAIDESLTTFRIGEVKFDPIKNRVSVDLEIPAPTVAAMLAESLRA
jgi:hypothetical protein